MYSKDEKTEEENAITGLPEMRKQSEREKENERARTMTAQFSRGRSHYTRSRRCLSPSPLTLTRFFAA